MQEEKRRKRSSNFVLVKRLRTGRSRSRFFGRVHKLPLLLTVDVVHFEEKLDFVVGRLAGELVHRVDELLQGNAAVVILVENVEDSFHEKRLKKYTSSA